MLVFKTNPKDVDIYIDGVHKGKANNLLVLDISPGTYTIKISKGDKSKEEELIVPSGGIVKVSLKLEEIPSLGGAKKSDTYPGYVYISSGTFQMGGYWSNSHPVHSVTISQPFFISDHEVTVGEYRKFIEETGYETPTRSSSYSKPSSCNWNKKSVEDHPINCVSWEDTQEYISWLNYKEGANVFRLPTEEEWEYVAKRGKDTKYFCGSSKWCVGDSAWYYKNSDGMTHPVKTKKPNDWGVYDMHGNVWEWLQSWYSHKGYPSGSASDPIDPNSKEYRVIRGGGWNSRYDKIRSGDRSAFFPGCLNCYTDFPYVGFRLVRIR